jgi:Peptidase family S41
MAKQPLRRFIGVGWATVVAALALGCSTYSTDSSGRDLLELESVWQYLKAYSIWQDSIPLPPNAFTYNTPKELLASVNDTLHGASYTRYDSSGGASVAAAPDSFASISFAQISQSTAYCQIWRFIRDTTYADFLAVLPALSRFSNIMLDLRWDGGGDLAALDSIIGYFLPVNTAYIVATYRSYDGAARTASTVHDERWTVKHDRSPSLAQKKIVVLLNRGSASASEIFAAGIKDGRASAGLSACLFVGDTSYGKGIGQILVGRSQFRKQDIEITFLRVFRACGCADSVYHRKGLVPDILVNDPNEAVADTLQFFAAFHVLEPGAVPTRYIGHFAKKQLAGNAEAVAPAIPDFEK